MTAPDPTAGEREPSPSTLWPHGPIVGHPKHDYYVCGSCHQPLAPGPCPAKVPTQPDPPTFDSLLSDPTQQLDSEGVVIRSIAASTGTSEDVEALLCLCHQTVCPVHNEAAGRVGEYDVPSLLDAIGSHVAAREAAARAEERERIAQAIEERAAVAERQRRTATTTVAHDASDEHAWAFHRAARIAREAR